MSTREKLIKARLMLALAEELQNISLACQRAGISRSHFYEIKEAFEKYGREGLAPQSRRRPRMPNQTPPETRAADPGDDRAIPHLQLPPHQPAASSDRRGRFALRFARRALGFESHSFGCSD